MEPGLIALKLFLNVLNEESDIGTLDDRVRIQKTVYLGQLSGINLGYHFGWHIKGPYSPSLARDYYALEEATRRGDKAFENRSLPQGLADKLRRIRPLLQVPPETGLTKVEWLELVASLHYLVKVSQYGIDDAIEHLKRTKTKIADHSTEARKALHEAGFLA